MIKPIINIADIDTSGMAVDDHALDAKVLGLRVKESLGQLPRGLKDALVRQFAAEHKCDPRTVYRHLRRRRYEPECNLFNVYSDRELLQWAAKESRGELPLGLKEALVERFAAERRYHERAIGRRYDLFKNYSGRELLRMGCQ